jgi:DivIVA domain-containing protein
MPRRKKDDPGVPMGFAEPDLEQTARPRLTAEEVQKKEFRLSFRGYHEGEVDEFLDHVTEDLAAFHEENKRLREQLGDLSGQNPLDLQAADQRAEQIVREAREHAARLVAEAEGRAADVTGGEVTGGGGTPNWYLLQERDFLQRLASLVQGHAEELKRQARAGAPAPAEPENAPAAGPGTESAPEEPAAEEAAVPLAGPASDETETEGEPAEESGEEVLWLPDEDEAGEERNQEGSDNPRLEETAPMSVAAPGGEPDLLSDWQTGSGSRDEDVRRRRRDDASLKELFWGEEP